MKILANTLLKNWINLISLLAPILTFAAPNPCDTNCALKLLAAHPAQGNFTSASWISACPTGAADLLQGCFANAAKVAASPIATIVNQFYTTLNTVPSSVNDSMYIRQFPPGYVFTAGGGRSVTMDATGVASPTQVMCAPAFFENGLYSDSFINNNPSAASGLSVVPLEGFAVSRGGSREVRVLNSFPGGSANNLQIPLYVVCVGFSDVNNAPSSLAGFTAF